MTTRTRSLAAVLSAVAVLTACSGGDDPAPAPTTAVTSAPAAPSETPTPTPTSVATAEHEAPVFTPSGEFTEGDAIGFAAFYVNVINHVRITGDPALLREYSLPECDTCAYIVEATDKIRSIGMRYDDPVVNFGELRVTYFDPATGEAEVKVEVTSALRRKIEASGRRVDIQEPEPIENTLAYIQMQYADGSWRFEEQL